MMSPLLMSFLYDRDLWMLLYETTDENERLRTATITFARFGLLNDHPSYGDYATD